MSRRTSDATHTRAPRFRNRAVAAGVAAFAVTAAIAASATGATTSAGTDFYTPPATLPVGNGDVVRSESADFYLDPLKAIKSDATVNRIMYRSTNHDGTPIAVTGTVLTPKAAWEGTGQRPVVGFAAGTQGMADRCAPSKAMASGLEYEGLGIKALLEAGYGVVLTDYQGLGTPGTHTYMSREVQGHAVLDAVRAAQRLPEAHLPDHGPVGLFGYSQGGGASAAAAELAPAYAPELDLKGAVAGAAPADLYAVAKNLDGGFYVGFLGYAVVGVAASYGIDTAPVFNDKGERLSKEVDSQCVVDSLPKYAFTKSSTLTEDGRSALEHLAEAPFAQVVAEQKIGDGRKPSAPVLLSHSHLDDVIPFQVGKDLAKRWCAQGSTVKFSANIAPTHIGGMVPANVEGIGYLKDRFSGKAAPDNCKTL